MSVLPVFKRGDQPAGVIYGANLRVYGRDLPSFFDADVLPFLAGGFTQSMASPFAVLKSGDTYRVEFANARLGAGSFQGSLMDVEDTIRALVGAGATGTPGQVAQQVQGYTQHAAQQVAAPGAASATPDALPAWALPAAAGVGLLAWWLS